MYAMLQYSKQTPEHESKCRARNEMVDGESERSVKINKHIGIFAEANKHKTDYNNSNNNINKLYERSH